VGKELKLPPAVSRYLLSRHLPTGRAQPLRERLDARCCQHAESLIVAQHLALDECPRQPLNIAPLHCDECLGSTQCRSNG
jgi:hypothetical protein